MAAKKKKEKKRICAHCDSDFAKYKLINKKTGRQIKKVIVANIDVGCVKVWKAGKNGTKFLEGLDLEWVEK